MAPGQGDSFLEPRDLQPGGPGGSECKEMLPKGMVSAWKPPLALVHSIFGHSLRHSLLEVPGRSCSAAGPPAFTFVHKDRILF